MFIDISELEPHPQTTPIFQCTLDTTDEAEKSDPFTDIEEDEDELEANELVLDDC